MYSKDKLNHELLPAHLRGGVERWIEQGIYPGSFLVGVITNDLRLAALQADPINRNRLGDIVQWFVQYAPAQCWGSQAMMQAWAEKGGLNE